MRAHIPAINPGRRLAAALTLFMFPALTRGWHSSAARSFLLAAIFFTAGCRAAQAAVTPTVFADSLMPDANHQAGAALDGISLVQGGAKWSASKGVSITTGGATTTAPGGGHHAITAVAGLIRIQATVRAQGSGFTGIALGSGDLSGNFWANLGLLFYVRSGGYGLLVGQQELIPKPDKALLRPDVGNRLEMSLDTVARTISAVLNGTVVIKGAALPPAVADRVLNAAGFRFNEPVTAGGPTVSDYRAEVLSAASAGLEPVDPGMVFVMPGKPAMLRWRVTMPGPTERVPYLISDYAGRQLEAGNATLAADGTVALTHSFARGYAEISFPDAHQTFGILAMEPHGGPADAFFGMDAALTWLELRPEARASLVTSLKRAGIAVARERLNIASLNPGPGAFEWQGERQNESMRRIYQEAGVEVLDELWGVPPHFEPNFNGKYPQNLVATAASWAEVARHFGPTWAAYEVGNEPDLDQPAMPADQYVVTVKAAAFASDNVTPRRPVIGGVFATVPPGAYFDACVANGLIDTVDGLSFHQYDRAPALQSQVQAYRDFVTAAGKPGLPLWLTECGHPWVMGPGRPPREQDADSAREISAKAVEARACGVARFFPFVLPFYEEGGIKSFSMFGREVTPLRSFAAYAWCVAALSRRDNVGDLRVGEPAHLARVFAGGDGSCVAVIYTDNLDADARVKLPLAPRRITGADGRTLQPNADGAMPLPDGLGYAWFDRAALKGALVPDTRAARLLAASRQPVAPRAKASPVVLQFPYRKEFAKTSKRDYLVTREAAAALPFTVRVQNLGDKPLIVTPTLHLPGAGPREMVHAPLALAPHSIAEASWTVDASAALDCCEIRFLRVTAACAEAPEVLPLAVPLVVESELDTILARFPKREALPIADLKRWMARGGNGQQTFSIPDQGAWRMDLSFTRLGDAWAYPFFTMPHAIDRTTTSGIVLRGRALKPAHNIMLILKDGPYEIWAEDLFEADGRWHSVYIPFDQLRYHTPGMQNEPIHLERISTLGVGLVSSTLENAMEVSDLNLVGQ